MPRAWSAGRCLSPAAYAPASAGRDGGGRERGLAQAELARGPLVRELFQAAEDQGDAIALGQPFQLVVNQVETLGIAAGVLRVGDGRQVFQRPLPSPLPRRIQPDPASTRTATPCSQGPTASRLRIEAAFRIRIRNVA